MLIIIIINIDKRIILNLLFSSFNHSMVSGIKFQFSHETMLKFGTKKSFKKKMLITALMEPFGHRDNGAT